MLGEATGGEADVLLGEQTGLAQAPGRDPIGQHRRVRRHRILARREVDGGEQLQAVRRLETLDQGEQRRETIDLCRVSIELRLRLLHRAARRVDRNQLGDAGGPGAAADQVVAFERVEDMAELGGARDRTGRG